jgi:fructose-1,6-bisphosphatase/inositol monophosphatase family enzyme
LYKVGKKVEEGYMDEGKEVSTKSDANDLLTKYDIKSNKQIIEHLENSYPEFSIISEEAKEIKKG